MLRNLHLTFVLCSTSRKYIKWRFLKILWPSQKIWILKCKNSLLVKILGGKKPQINFQNSAHFFFNFPTLLVCTTLPKMFCIPKVAKIFEDAKIINWRFLWNVRILYCRKVSIFHTVQKWYFVTKIVLNYCEKKML